MDPNVQPVTRGMLRDELREGLREALRPIYAILANHTAELAEIRHHIKTELVTKSEFHARMDGFAKRVHDQDYHSVKALDRLDDHERRLKRLERKPS